MYEKNQNYPCMRVCLLLVGWLLDLDGNEDDQDAEGDDDDASDASEDTAAMLKALQAGTPKPPVIVTVPHKESILRKSSATRTGAPSHADKDRDDDDEEDEDEDEDDALPPPSGLTKGAKPRMSVEQANANLSKATRQATNYNWHEYKFLISQF